MPYSLISYRLPFRDIVFLSMLFFFFQPLEQSYFIQWRQSSKHITVVSDHIFYTSALFNWTSSGSPTRFSVSNILTGQQACHAILITTAINNRDQAMANDGGCILLHGNLNSDDYFKYIQHAGLSPVTHHTTPSHRDWVTIDYKHTLHTRPIPLPHPLGIGWPVHTYWLTGWDWTHDLEEGNLNPDHLAGGTSWQSTSARVYMWKCIG